MKKTTILNVPSLNIEEDKIEQAATILRKGGIVAFPTETVYGLGADAFNPEAVEKIFKAKGRPGDNPLIVHIARDEELYDLAKEVPEKAVKLAEAFWPGPMTMVLKKTEKIPKSVSAGLDTVGIRMPSNPVARKLLKSSGIPIAAPSANISGRPSPTTAAHVLEDMTGRADAIVVSEDCEVGVESTVIDLTKDIPVILRPGMVTQKDIEEVIGKVSLSEGITTGEVPEHPASPGMKYTHYSPKAEVVLVTGSPEEIKEKITEYIKDHPKLKVGILSSVNQEDAYKNLQAKVLNLGEDAKDYAKNLFNSLRRFDSLGVNVILAEQFLINDKSLAAADRLLHASGYRSI